ncbi:MAG: branched-chain amino acid ABC transporter permease [Syntrophorhabdaceae bacterium]|nr:branched-chain amino acid ABC transporter permease [Syntrophorhabdaceae bacterium]
MRFFLESRKFLLLSFAVYGVAKVSFLTGLFSQYIEQITLFSLIVCITSLGLNVIYGYTGQFSLGHAAFYGIGAYTSAFICKTLSIDGAIPYVFVLIASGIVAGTIGYIIGVPILKLRDDFLAIATLGFGTLVRVFLDNSDRLSDTLGGSRGFVGISKITNLELTFFTAIFTILLTRNLIYSRYGLFWKCIKEDELASVSVGIDTTKMKLMAFSYGCFLAGIGGSLYAHLYTFIHPSNFDILKSIDFLIIVIIGGMGSITGTIFASLVWVGFIEGLRIILPPAMLELRWVIIPVLLIALMMWRPYGLMVKKR